MLTVHYCIDWPITVTLRFGRSAMTVNYFNFAMPNYRWPGQGGSVMTLTYCAVSVHQTRWMHEDGMRWLTKVQYGYWVPRSLQASNYVSKKSVNYNDARNSAKLYWDDMPSSLLRITLALEETTIVLLHQKYLRRRVTTIIAWAPEMSEMTDTYNRGIEQGRFWMTVNHPHHYHYLLLHTAKSVN